MIELELTKFRKARIWVNSFPETAIDSAEKVEQTYPFQGASLRGPKVGTFALEINIPFGGRMAYGLLGAEFHQEILSSFVLEIYSSESTNVPFNKSIYGGSDRPLVGLPLIFSNVVKKGVLEYLENSNHSMPKGKLTFTHAAFSEVGSSEDIFKKLGIIISSYFFTDNDFKDNKDYIDLLSLVL